MRTFLLLILVLIANVCDADEKSIYLENAYAVVKDKKIEVSTGLVKRVWEISDKGLISLVGQLKNGDNVLNPENRDDCWNAQGRDSKGKLLNVEMKVDDDEGFTTKHIAVNVDFRYAQTGIDVRYTIWVFPAAQGIRTQLFIKRNSPGIELSELGKGKSENFLLRDGFEDMRAIGYYNDTQHRNQPDTPILESKAIEKGQNIKVDWANLLCLSDGQSGIILVKESPKCVNQSSVNTGGFLLSDNHVSVYGLGIEEKYLTHEFRPCWATWTIFYKGGESEMQFALKKFDRIRYPVNKDQDIYIMANTWGSGDTGVNSKYASREENVLAEINSVSDLGIDVLQIDDGWQGSDHDSWQPAGSLIYSNTNQQTVRQLPNGIEYDVYPEGWKNVKAKAASLNIKLGLWAACWIGYDDLVKNYEDGSFNFFKLDFAKLDTYGQFYDLVTKVRNFSLFANHQVRVNWDVTENDSRMGYYFGREYGNIFLENRKPRFPQNVIYQPYLVLRDAWHVARYTNLNKFQVSCQNADMVDKTMSDAYLHSHDYCLAITLMATPLFFQETHLLSENARKEIRDLIQIYKQCRSDMYNGIVYPIGDEPSNSSWTGFQNIGDDKMHGYLLIFRERLNQNHSSEIALNFLNGKNIQLKNLLTGETKVAVNRNGKIDFNINKAGDYSFYKYEIAE